MFSPLQEQHEQELLSLFELQEQHSQQIFADIEQAHAARLASLSADLEASRAELAATKRQLALRSGDAADLASMSAVELAELAGLVEKGLAKIREAKVRWPAVTGGGDASESMHCEPPVPSSCSLGMPACAA